MANIRELELTAHYPHANGNLSSGRVSHISFFPSSAAILLVVRSANGDGIVYFLSDDTYRWN